MAKIQKESKNSDTPKFTSDRPGVRSTKYQINRFISIPILNPTLIANHLVIIMVRTSNVFNFIHLIEPKFTHKTIIFWCYIILCENHRYWLIGCNNDVAVGKFCSLIIDRKKGAISSPFSDFLNSNRKTGIICILIECQCRLLVDGTAQGISRITNARL